MLFLSPALLWFLAAALVPVAIHLLNRRRHKTIPWAAMQFLLKATRESRGKKKLRYFLILACRTLALAALVLAAARPVLSGFLGWGGSIDTVVLVLDRSASMELRSEDGGPSRREQLLKQVTQTMADLDAARLVLIDSASQTPQEISTPDVLGQLTAAAATDTTADVPSLLIRAAEFLTDTTGRSEIWLASDLQASNWRADDERWSVARASLASLPRRPALRVISLSGPAAANTSLRITSTRRTKDGLLAELEFFRSADSRGGSAVPLTTRQGSTSTTETITLPGQALRMSKLIPLPAEAATGYGWLSIPPDGNPRDNSAFFAYGPAKPANILLVSEPGETADYLALAAAPPGLQGLTLRKSTPAAAAASIAGDLAAILWAAPFPDETTAALLQKFLSEGGQVAFFPNGSPSQKAFLDLRWQATVEAPSGKFLMLKDWNHSDGPMRDSADGTPVAASRLKAIRRQSIDGDATPLARWEDGEAFLCRKIIDRGTAWFVGSQPDYIWSNLGDGDVLLPLVQRVVQDGAARFDASYLAFVQSSTAQPAAGESRARLDDYGTPDPANAAYEAGIFQVGDRLLAVNRPPAEDVPEILSREALESALEGTTFTLLDTSATRNEGDLSYDAWRAFLIACLLFLIAEAALCLPPAPSKRETAEISTDQKVRI